MAAPITWSDPAGNMKIQFSSSAQGAIFAQVFTKNAQGQFIATSALIPGTSIAIETENNTALTRVGVMQKTSQVSSLSFGQKQGLLSTMGSRTVQVVKGSNGLSRIVIGAMK